MRPFSNGGLPSVAVLVNRHTRQQKLLKKKFHLFCLLCRLCHFSLTRCQHLFFFASFPRDRGSNPSVSSDAAEAIARSEFGLGFTFSRCLAQRSSPAQRPRGSAHSQRAAGGLRISQSTSRQQTESPSSPVFLVPHITSSRARVCGLLRRAEQLPRVGL